MSVLLDTNVLVDYLRNRQAASDFIHGCTGRPAISVCTIAELFAGASDRREEDRITQLPAILAVLPVTFEIARAAGQHLKHYGASNGLDDIDALIAATAEHHGLRLATLNVRHFPMFSGLKAAY